MNAPTKGASLVKFDALEAALDLLRALMPVIAKIRRQSRSEADQLLDAAKSIVRNLGEGSGRLGRDRMQYFAVACGSAREVKSSVRICLATGWITDADLVDARPFLDRVMAMTWKLTH